MRLLCLLCQRGNADHLEHVAHTVIVVTHTNLLNIPLIFTVCICQDPPLQTKEKYKRTDDHFYRIGKWIQQSSH